MTVLDFQHYIYFQHKSLLSNNLPLLLNPHYHCLPHFLSPPPKKKNPTVITW